MHAWMQGPLLTFIFAVRELLASGRKLPVNVTFCFEGEEENGSRGFKQTVTENLRCACAGAASLGRGGKRGAAAGMWPVAY